jgi:hypothetical protein
MPDPASPERIAALAAAARAADARRSIAGAVTPTVARYTAENITLPLETEPSSFLVVQMKDAAR